jgi:hypothetical protein
MTILEIPHLQDRFRAGMERRLAEVDEAVFDEARLHEVESVFHSIAGIGGTYGHPVVSTIASAVEQICAEAARAAGTHTVMVTFGPEMITFATGLGYRFLVGGGDVPFLAGASAKAAADARALLAGLTANPQPADGPKSPY